MGERAKSVLLHPFRDSENLWLSKTPGKISKLYKVIGGDVRKADFFHVGLLIIVQGKASNSCACGRRGILLHH